MSNKSRKNAAKAAPVETPVVETTTIAAPETAAPAAPETPAEPKAKKVRYAPTTVLDDAAVITGVKANPKRVGSKSFARYAKYYREGITVAEYVAAYKADNLPGMLARNDLRWDVQHGFITIGVKVAEEA